MKKKKIEYPNKITFACSIHFSDYNFHQLYQKEADFECGIDEKVVVEE
jgi:hypothetical protein